jgi:hypothetical protein
MKAISVFPGKATKDLFQFQTFRAPRQFPARRRSKAGCSTRSYHGLLVAATKPPVGRLVLTVKIRGNSDH